MKTYIDVHEPYLKGWGTDYSSSQDAAIETAESYHTKSSGTTLYRQGKIGHIAPGYTFTALTDASTRVNALPIAATTVHSGDGGSTYDNECLVLLDNNRVVRFGPGDDTVDTTYSFSYGGTGHVGHTAPGSAVTIGTILQQGGYAYFSWADNTDGDIGRIDLTAGTVNANYMDALAGWGKLDIRYPVSGWIGPDNILYWAQGGSSVGSFIQASETANQTAFSLGSGWVGMSGCAYSNYSVIGASPFGNVFNAPSTLTSGRCRVYFWDGVKATADFIYEVDDYKLTKVYNDNGILKVWTQGKGGTVKVWYFDGGKFVLLSESAQIGSAPGDYQVDSFENMMTWVSGTDVYGLDGKYLHTRTKVHNGTTTVDSVGFCKNLADNKLYVGMKVGSNYYIGKTNRSGYYPSGDFRTRLRVLPHRSTIKKIRVYFSQFGSGASLLLSLFKDFNAMSVGGAADLLNTTINATNYPTASTYFVAEINKTIPDVSSYYINLRFNHSSATDTAAIVRRIEVVYEDANK